MLPPPLRFMDQDVPWKTPVTYLGVTIDRRLSMRHHVKRAVGRAKGAMNALYPLTGNILLRVKLALYKLYVRPHLTYAAPAWYSYTKECNRQRLRIVQNINLRRAVGAPRYVRNATIARDLRMESIDEFVARFTKGMFDRADASQHPHLKDIAPWHSRPPDKYRYLRELFSADTTNTGRDARAATAATTAGRLAGPPPGPPGVSPGGA
ncbi:unnamed protein product [Pieris macdunnoughi]|uniref:RNA-directed DNA polymerase from mobile element jockey n=1 Tax=Pieris macdunnoughi TaxID=345717 RepID=A0A821W5J9_9NEOP|nr:unnamed protein product [Pieris macdunnoughi]